MRALISKVREAVGEFCWTALIACVATVALSVGPTSAHAAIVPKPAWKLLAVTGPTNLPPEQSELQRLTVEAMGGTYTLVNSSEGVGTMTLGEGELAISSGSNKATVVDGTFAVGEKVTGLGIPPAPPTTVVSVTPGAPDTVTLSAAATSTSAARTIKIFTKQVTGVSGSFAVGDLISGEGIPAGTTVAAVGPSSLTLSLFPTILATTTTGLTGTETTGAIAYDAPAEALQSALEALPAIGSDNVAVSGGPGGDAVHPYAVDFDGVNGQGVLADQDVGQLRADGAALEGKNAAVHVVTVVPGGPGTGELVVFPTNIGGKATSGEVTVDVGPLPGGVVTGGIARGEGWTCVGAAGQEVASCNTTEITLGLGSGRNTVRSPVRIPLRVVGTVAADAVVPIVVSGGGGGSAEEDAAIAVSPKDAQPGIQAMWAGAFEADGTPSTQAGGHPFSDLTFFLLNTVRSASGEVVPAADLKRLEVDLPPGFLGDPLATGRCPQNKVIDCGTSAVIGSLVPIISEFGEDPSAFTADIDNDVPAPGLAAEFMSKVAFPVQPLLGSVRSEEDFGIHVLAPEVATYFRVYGSLAELEGEPIGSPGVAWFRNPTDCAEEARETPLEMLGASPWQPPGAVSREKQLLQPVTGCSKLHFEPEFSLQPTSTQGSSGVGATAHLRIDQSNIVDPNVLATPDLKQSVVTLPPGLDVNPAQANGLEACTEAQVGYQGAGSLPNPTRFDNDPVTCPDGSKLGTVEAITPLLEEPLKGTIYLAAQEENPFHSLIALYLVIESLRFGVTLKLPGQVDTNPTTGQVTATFDYVPQQPVEDLKLDFRGGGPRSEFSTPEVCGTYSTKASWEPWSAPESGPPSQTSDPFTVSSGCSSSAATRPFHPSFEGGAVNPLSGAYSPLVIKINRNDGEQELSSLDFTLPPGESARLAGVPYCSEAAIAAAGAKTGKAEQASPSCPAASQIGTVDAAAGVGSEPFHASGKAYLAGPYKGAPISAVVITPAVAGPFDLGDVVIRSPLYVDPETAQVTAKSDPIPTILRGIPLKIRSVAISIDRSAFSLNPTNCEAMSISATVGSSDGASAAPANRFQVGDCANLKFKPELKISLEGSTKHAGHPALKAVLTYPKQGAYSNIRRAQVNLPHSEFLDQGNLNKTCTKPVLLAGNCPRSTIYGKAKAWTPLLEKPLEGNVYLVGGYGYKLPALVAELDGQIRVVLKGKVDSGKNKGIRNTFEAVPDAPVSRFVLQLKGGKKYSLLENSENLCAKPQRAIARFTAQNGLVQQAKPLIANDCGKRHARKKKAKSASR